MRTSVNKAVYVPVYTSTYKGRQADIDRRIDKWTQRRTRVHVCVSVCLYVASCCPLWDSLSLPLEEQRVARLSFLLIYNFILCHFHVEFSVLSHQRPRAGYWSADVNTFSQNTVLRKTTFIFFLSFFIPFLYLLWKIFFFVLSLFFLSRFLYHLWVQSDLLPFNFLSMPFHCLSGEPCNYLWIIKNVKGANSVSWWRHLSH